jgi:hypothetical protein
MYSRVTLAGGFSGRAEFSGRGVLARVRHFLRICWRDLHLSGQSRAQRRRPPPDRKEKNANPIGRYHG